MKEAIVRTPYSGENSAKILFYKIKLPVGVLS
jgi:hypothetical protein